MKNFWHVHEDAQDKNEWKLRIKRQPTNPRVLGLTLTIASSSLEDPESSRFYSPQLPVLLTSVDLKTTYCVTFVAFFNIECQATRNNQ